MILGFFRVWFIRTSYVNSIPHYIPPSPSLSNKIKPMDDAPSAVVISSLQIQALLPHHKRYCCVNVELWCDTIAQFHFSYTILQVKFGQAKKIRSAYTWQVIASHKFTMRVCEPSILKIEKHFSDIVRWLFCRSFCSSFILSWTTNKYSKSTDTLHSIDKKRSMRPSHQVLTVFYHFFVKIFAIPFMIPIWSQAHFRFMSITSVWKWKSVKGNPTLFYTYGWTDLIGSYFVWTIITFSILKRIMTKSHW